MAIIINKLGWRATIEGLNYGTDFEIDFKGKSNEQIADIVETVSFQIRDSIQKIVNGKTSHDKLVEKILKEYKHG